MPVPGAILEFIFKEVWMNGAADFQAWGFVGQSQNNILLCYLLFLLINL